MYRKKNLLQYVIIALLCFVFYGTTLSNDYSLDDNIVNYKNENVSKGVEGIPALFQSRYVVNENQNFGYRPITLVSFAVEHELFGASPFYGHLINIILYVITCMLLFALFKNLLKKYHWSLPFIIVLVFIVHPIHSEVVNNIKSRDELLSFLFALLSLFSAIKYIEKNSYLYLVFSAIFLLCALLSKLSALTFLAIIPLTLYFFKNAKIRQLTFWAVGSILLVIATRLSGKVILDSVENSRELLFMENPFFDASYTFFDRIPMAFYSVGYYLKLLIFPKPLLFYYGYNKIPILSWDSVQVWFSVVAIAVLIYIAIKNFKLRKIYSYGILYFLISISMFSNLVKPAVGIIAERFAYIPSLGFCIVIGYGIFKVYQKFVQTKSTKTNYIITTLFSCIVISGICIYVWDRNKDWKDEITLVSNDIEHLHNSVKANSLLGDYLLFKSQGIKDFKSRKKVSVKAIKYYKQALKLLPSYSKGHNNLAVLYNELGDYKNAQYHAQRGLNKGNLTKHNYFNLAVANHYSDNNAKAEQAYLKTIAMDSTYLTAYTQLAKLYHENKNTEKALTITAQMLSVFPEKQQEILHQGQQLAMSAYGDNTLVFIDLLLTKGYIDQALYNQFKNELEK